MAPYQHPTVVSGASTPYSRCATPSDGVGSYSAVEYLPGNPEPPSEGVREGEKYCSHLECSATPRQLLWSGSSASSLKGTALQSLMELESTTERRASDGETSRVQPVTYSFKGNSAECCPDAHREHGEDIPELESAERLRVEDVEEPSRCGGEGRDGACGEGGGVPTLSSLTLKSRLSIQDSANLTSQVLADVPLPQKPASSIRFPTTTSASVPVPSGSGVPFQEWKARQNRAKKEGCSRKSLSHSGVPSTAGQVPTKPRQLNLSNTINQVGKRAAEGRLTVFSRRNWTKMGRECLFSVVLEFLFCGVMAGVLTALEGDELADVAGDVFVYADRVSHTFAKYTASVYIIYSGMVRIGYGDLVPLTDSGRWWTMAACTGGSVLNIVSIIKLSKLLNATFALVSGRLGMNHIDSVIRLEACAYSALLVLLLCGNAAVWQAITNSKSEEPWSYTEAFWHSWQTFATVGYGDFAIMRMQYVTPLTVWYMCVVQWLGLAVTNSVLMRGVEMLWRNREYSREEHSYRIRDRLRNVMNLLRRKGFNGADLSSRKSASSKSGSRVNRSEIADSLLMINPARVSVDQKWKEGMDNADGGEVMVREISGASSSEGERQALGSKAKGADVPKLRRHSTEYLLQHLGEAGTTWSRVDGEQRKKSRTAFNLRKGGGDVETEEKEATAMSFAGDRAPNSVDLVHVEASESLGQTSMGRRIIAKRHQTLASFPVLSEFLDISEGVISGDDNVAHHTIFNS